MKKLAILAAALLVVGVMGAAFAGGNGAAKADLILRSDNVTVVGFVTATPFAAGDENECWVVLNVVVDNADPDTEYGVEVGQSPSGYHFSAGELMTNKHGKGHVNLKVDLCRFANADGLASIKVALMPGPYAMTPAGELEFYVK